MRIRHIVLPVVVFLTPIGLIRTQHQGPASAIRARSTDVSSGVDVEVTRADQIQQEANASIAAQAAAQVELDKKAAEAQAETDAATSRQAARQAVAHQAASTTTVAKPSTSTKPTTSTGSGNCGGNLPPCYVMQRESRGSLTVYNAQGSGASGKWQFMPGTWNGYGGYANAADAPESVQDARAAQVWAGGAGCGNWSAC